MKSIAKDKRRRRDLHVLDEDGMVLCNPRDKEAAHRGDKEGLATLDYSAVTCSKCIEYLYKAKRQRASR